MGRDDLGKICWNLRKRPIVLLIVLVILFICSEKFHFISNVKPRRLWNKLSLKRILLNKRIGWSNFLIFLRNITSYACLLKSDLKSSKPNWLLHLGLGLKWLHLYECYLLLKKETYHRQKSLQFEKRSLDKSFR